MEYSWIEINNIPTKLITLGQNVSQKPKKIILIIPGMLTTYQTFKEHIYV